MAVEEAVRRAEAMAAEGAVCVDVGGESSRPKGRAYGAGAEAVDASEELRRVVPVVEAISARVPGVLISVDTYKAEVARAALEAGAHVVNDITGLRLGAGVAEACAEFGAPLVVMHSLGRPGTLPQEHVYTDVVAEVTASLRESVARAEAAGVRDVVVDAGFGFGKRVSENLALLRHTDRLLAELRRPVLVGISRKSTIGAVLGVPGDPAPIAERLFGSLGATAVAVLRGATLVRTHDVKPTVELLRVLAATA